MLVRSKQALKLPKPIPLEEARLFAQLPREEKQRFLLRVSRNKAINIKHTWAAWARDKQLWQIEAPWSWDTWFLCAGRGFGKTRTGAQQIIEWAADDAEARMALVGRTVADVRDVMVGGKSGILACSPPWFRPEYKPSQRKLIWPNGAIAFTYTAEKPDQMRGPQHSKAWGDERAAWQYDDAWDQLQFGLRLGAQPQTIVTSTPRATKAVKELLREPGTHFTRGNTYENTANLARKFIQQIERKYGGTRLGRQEIGAEILDDNPGALWKREAHIERYCVARDQVPPLKRVVVAVDPAVKSPDPQKAARGELDESVAETGIVVAGLGMDDQAYVLADYSMQGQPLEWAQAGVNAFDLWKADVVVGEVNNGGDLVESNFRTVRKNISYQAVHATRGKLLRAEPVSSIYQQGRVHHVGTFPDLEDQQCNWCPGERSPDRLDALCWAIHALMIEKEEGGGVLLATATDEDVALFGQSTDILSAWSGADQMEW